MATIIIIKDLSDTGILVATALVASATSGQSLENWKRAAEIYSFYKLEIAYQMIEEQLGDEYLLDVETCRDWLKAEEAKASC